MPDLKHRQEKIQEKRKQTPWREFVMEICSRYPMVLYRNNNLLSRYPQGARKLNVVDAKTYAHHVTEAEKYSLEGGEGFFKSFHTLFASVPLSALFNTSYNTVENAAYADIVSSSKNVYLSWNVTKGCENVSYSIGVKDGCVYVMDSLMVWDHSEIVYSSRGVISSHTIFYSQYIYNSSDIWFCTNMMNCQHCLFCDNLENASYYIDNVQYTKEEYSKKKQILLRERSKYTTYKTYMDRFTPENYSSQNVEGSFVIYSKDVSQGMFVYNTQRGHNMILGGYSFGEEDIYDTLFCGCKAHVYGILCCGSKSEYLYSCIFVSACMYMFYCYDCHSCSYCLGCVGLKNKSFCIFNKQYTKEVWHEKVDEIFQKMENTPLLTSPQGEEKRDINGDIVTELGAFFPGSMNPFYFNDTAAYLIDDSFTKEEVEAEGYLWRDEEVKVDIPEGMEVVKVSELGHFEGWSQTPPPDSVGDLPLSGEPSDGSSRCINPEILKKVIQDEEGNVYRIVKMEYDFLVKHGLPLPRLHWLDRLKINFKIT